MDPTDFDLICAGATADETRRLTKMLLEWSTGDQNGFPAQIALLTRAQFRAAATVPKTLREVQEGLRQEFSTQQQQISAQVTAYTTTTAVKLGELERMLKEHQSHTSKAISSLRGEVEEAQAVAKQVRAELEAGAKSWKQAQSDFEKGARRLTQACSDLQSRPWISHWVMSALLVIAAGALGYCATKLGLW